MSQPVFLDIDALLEQLSNIIPLPGISRAVTTVTASVSSFQIIPFVDAISGLPLVFKDSPSVIAAAEVRVGSIVPSRFQIPVFQIPSFELNIPRVRREDLRIRIGEQFEQTCRQALGDWRVGILDLNFLRDTVCRAFRSAGGVVGFFFNFFWDFLVQPQIDQIQSATIGSIRRSISEFRTNIQSVINVNTRQAETALNEAIPKLYEFMGVNDSIVMTPIATRNIGLRSFEVIVPKGVTKIHHIAIGTK